MYILIQIFRSSPEFYEKHNLQEEDLPNFWTPRFKFPFKFEASGTMKELGKVLPFSLVGGFSEMVDSPGSLVLSKVFHESSIQVNEKVTEAAASTAPRFINYVAGCILKLRSRLSFHVHNQGGEIRNDFLHSSFVQPSLGFLNLI